VYLMHNEKYFGVATVTIPGVYTMDEACSTKDHRVYYVKRYPMTRTYKGIPYDGWAVWSFDLV
jgi:cephalosporin hydroxylase